MEVQKFIFISFSQTHEYQKYSSLSIQIGYIEHFYADLYFTPREARDLLDKCMLDYFVSKAF